MEVAEPEFRGAVSNSEFDYFQNGRGTRGDSGLLPSSTFPQQLVLSAQGRKSLETG